MRPRGEIRVALGQAAADLGGTGATWRDLAHRAKVGLETARRTVENMVNAGELIVIGHQPTPHACRPMRLYAMPAPQSSSGPELDQVVRCWADFR